MTLLEFLVLVLAVHRVVHLVVEDQMPLARWPREAAARRKPDGLLSYLLGCFWCASVWVSAAAALFVFLWGPAPTAGWKDWLWYPALGAALSSAAAFFETLVQRLDAGSVGG